MSLGVPRNHRRSNRLCGARLSAKQRLVRGHEFCRAIASANGRCRFHGGASIGWRTPEGAIRRDQARTEGIERWRERMRAAIAAGLIDRFPQGRKPGSKNKSKPPPATTAATTPSSRKEQNMPRKKTAPAAAAPAIVPIAAVPVLDQRAALVAWRGKTRADKLDELTDEALDIVRWVFRLAPNADVNPRILSAKKDAALSVLALEFKVGESLADRERKERDRALVIAEIARRVEEAGGGK
jgi:hypothetical protein